MKLPTITAVIPTLNAGRVLRDCLESIRMQEYPQHLVEIIIADGGSRDNTRDIARSFKANIIRNPQKTSESGKACGIKKAKGDLILLIDSDNLLEEAGWLRKMVAPFSDRSIVGSEPIRFSLRRDDPYIDRYCALIGANDPFCMFLGNYDRFNYATGRWTEVPVTVAHRDGYLKISAASHRFITMGANGFIGRRTVLQPYARGEYYFDIDVTKDLALHKHAFFAKVDVGIVHRYAADYGTFVKKQTRRVKDFLYFQSQRNYAADVLAEKTDIPKANFIKFILSCTLVFPLAGQALRGYLRKPDSAWLFHIPACLTTLVIYVRYVGAYLLFSKSTFMERHNW